MRSGLRAEDRPGSARRRRAVGGQRLRRLPVRDRAGQADGGVLRDRAPVVTGIGVVAPTGSAPRSTGRPLAGELRVRPDRPVRCPRYGTRLPGRSTDFDVERSTSTARLRVQTDRWTWMSLAAAQLALDDAQYDPAEHDPYDTSVVLAAGSGGNEFGQREIQALWSQGTEGRRAPTSRSPGSTRPAPGRPRSGTAPRARRGCWSAEGAGGLDSLGYARRRGAARHARGARRRHRGAAVAVRAGVPGDQRPADDGSRTRATAYKPFDVGANGYVPGEGGAVLVVEDGTRRASAARRRSTARSPGTPRRTTRTTTRIRRRTRSSTRGPCGARSPTPG